MPKSNSAPNSNSRPGKQAEKLIIQRQKQRLRGKMPDIDKLFQELRTQRGASEIHGSDFDGLLEEIEKTFAGYADLNERLSREIEGRKKIEKTLAERLRFERLLSDLSSRFISLMPGEVDREINNVLRSICEYLDIDLAALWQCTSASPNFLTMTHLYRPIGGPPIPEWIDARELFPWCLTRVLAGEIVAVRTDNLPQEATRDREVWRHLGIKSSLTFPLSAGGGPLIGIMGFFAIRKVRLWPVALVKRLQLVADVFANALARKGPEQALRESEERLRLAATAAKTGLWILYLNKSQFWLTEQARELLGLAADENIDLDRFLDICHPDDRERIRLAVQQSVQADEDFRIEYRVLYPGGKISWMVSRGHAYFDPSGVPERLMGVTMDITERRMMIEKIQAASREWQATFDAISDMVMILDQDHRIIQANAAAVSFLKRPMERLEGRLCHNLVHRTDEPVRRCPLAVAIKTRKHEETDLYDHDKDAWLHVSVVPVLNDQGVVSRFVHTIRDITEKKRAEAESFRSFRDMLRIERLLRMGELTASLAHELNQPLTAILGNARAGIRFIESGTLDMDECKQILQDIADDDKRAGSIIRSLRSMARPEEGEREAASINDVLVEAISLFHSDAIIRNIMLENDLADPLPLVRINKVQVQQVVINLLANAAESVTDGSADKRIVIRTSTANDGGVQVIVRDFGPGIEEKELDDIFEPFFTTKRSGLGLGLSLSRSIIEAHGGRIKAENNPDQGTTFTFHLPAAGER